MASLETVVKGSYIGEETHITPDLEYIKVITPKGIEYIVTTTNHDKVSPESIDRMLHKYEDKKALRQAVESINKLNEGIKNYVTNHKSMFDNFLTSHGYNLTKILEGRQASNIIDQAAAYTDAERLIGVNIDFQKAVKHMARRANISEETATNLIIHHEMYHTTQETNLEELVANPAAYKLNKEFETEMVLTAYIYYLASHAKSKKQIKELEKAAEYTTHRASVIAEWAHRKGHKLENVEKLTNLAGNYKDIYKAKKRGVEYIQPPMNSRIN